MEADFRRTPLRFGVWASGRGLFENPVNLARGMLSVALTEGGRPLVPRSSSHHSSTAAHVDPALSVRERICAPAIFASRTVFSPTPTIAIRNQLLSALPPEVLASLTPKLRHVSLAVHDSLVVPSKVIDAVYFVESGWVSLVTTLENGEQAEVGLIGREGIVGLPLIVGVDTGFEEAFVRAPGTALQMEAGVFRRILEEFPILQARLYRYSEAMHAQATQMVACNGRHSLEQRLARWLLMGHDRCEGDDLPVTQESLALMLCVYRPSVTVIAGALQRGGIIRYSRGHITILDRRALEETACDCYAAVQRRFDTLLGLPILKDLAPKLRLRGRAPVRIPMRLKLCNDK
jgi:CRP-like cAMP-binding protein